MSKPTLSAVDRKKLSIAEEQVLDSLEQDLNLISLFIKRLVVTFELHPRDLFPDVFVKEEKSSSVPFETLTKASEDIPKKENPSKKMDPLETDKSLVGELAVRFDGLSVILKNRIDKVDDKGKDTTLLTNLKDKSKDLSALFSTLMKLPRSDLVTDRQLATYNNSLLAFIQSVSRLTSRDHQLPQAARNLIAKLDKNRVKAVKLWVKARTLDATKWNVDQIIGNITEKSEDSPETKVGGDKEDEDW